MNTASKLVEIATAKVTPTAKKLPTVKEIKKLRTAVDIAYPATPGLVVTLGPGSVRKMREFDKLRTELDRISSEMEGIRLYFAKQAGCAEVAIIGKSGKALYRDDKFTAAYEVKARTIRKCTIAKAPPAK